ncbi:hypothetical protein TL16_g13103 [Triparma laevis f. inornata]|uniref:Response regulator transcription factor n=1 Tax=Triparma laevis f. inornata TaxID=1714386 RepID=A0A9W7BRM2_9STRA|nr:hypothetical protein TL16_g13103 [Triparma laevis f. inornata]
MSDRLRPIIYLIDDELPLLTAVQSYLNSTYTVYAFSSPQPIHNLITSENFANRFTSQPSSPLNPSTIITEDFVETSSLLPFPSCIITDINMPPPTSPKSQKIDKSGLNLLSTLRSSTYPQIAKLPVIMLTARGMTEDRIEGYRVGCDGYLGKPFDPEELEVVVEGCLERVRRNEPIFEGGSATATSSDSEIAALQASINEIKTLLTTTSKAPVPTSALLTPKEKLVLLGISEGLMNKEIARDMEISVRSVERHVTNLLEKSGKGSRTELLRWGVEVGLVKI